MHSKSRALLNSAANRWKASEFSTKPDRSPLSGIRILDMSRVLAGPFATMVLGDLGAEIIKIENPIAGDDTRSWGPPFVEGGSRESTYFLSVNRNKKSVCIDIKKPTGQKILQKLAEKSDVLVENFKPGSLEEKGLGYEQLSKSCPRLVYCSISGFGDNGPYKNRGGYDVIAASMGGLSYVTGEKDGIPMKVGVAVTDLGTALYAHGAILAALYQRELTGSGQKIDCNLLSSQVSLMVNVASTYLNGGLIPGRWGTQHASIVPYQTFQTADGYLTLGCGNDGQFRQFCEKIGEPALASNPDFSSNEKRVKNREELVPLLSTVLRSETNSTWCDKFEGSNFAFGPVNQMDKVFCDPQVQFNNLQQTVEHATLGEVNQVGPAVKFSYAENRIRCGPPVLGQDTDIVLRSLLGHTDESLKTLRSQGVIR